MHRTIAGLILGLIAAFAVVFVLETLGNQLFPLPDGFNFNNPGDLARLTGLMPLPAKLIVVAAWFFGALAGGWVALGISRRTWSPSVAACVIAAAAITNLFRFPHPVWMQACTVLAPMAGAWLSLRLPFWRAS